ncbi:MAG: DNA/RNA nuclease SfsA [Hellea sp.]|nr:DNA/RNA nuclease SfsA [Hellea sp.]
MIFPAPIQEGVLIQRYKRFLADIDLNGEMITAHCANPGSMMGVQDKGAAVWVSKAQNKSRKLKWDWQVIEVDGARVCINTATANPIVEEAILAGKIPELSGYESFRREVKYGQNSRIDFRLEDPARPLCYLEIKNVTLSRTPGLAEFPDSPTARGTKHLIELSDMVREGHRAVMLYLVNRTDCSSFKLAEDIDPNYAARYAKAIGIGVESLVFRTDIIEDGITLNSALPTRKP